MSFDRSRNQQSPFWLWCYLVAASLLLTQAFWTFIVEQPTAAVAGGGTTTPSATNNLVYVGLWIALWLWTAGLVARSITKSAINTHLAAVAGFWTLVLASALWSVDPGRTLYFGSMLIANTCVVYVIASQTTPTQFFSTVSTVFNWCFLLSLALVPIVPNLVMGERYGGDWLGGIELRGVFSHKSNLGYFASINLLIVLSGVNGKLGSAKNMFAILTTVVVLAMTNSAAGAVSAVLGAIFLAFAIQNAFLLTSATIGCALLFTLVQTLVPLGGLGASAEYVGRDADMTGRAVTWEMGLEAVVQRPLLGYGYNGFFSQDNASPAWKIWDMSPYFKTPHFHNSVLETAAGLGLVGVVAYLFLLTVAFSAIRNTTLTLPERALIAACLLVTILNSTFDSAILAHNTLASGLIFYAVFVGPLNFARRRERLLLPSAAAGDQRKGSATLPWRPAAEPAIRGSIQQS